MYNIVWNIVVFRGFQGFIVKNIGGESTEASDLIIFCRSGSVAKKF